MNQTHVLTGKPSIDRPWMKFYPAEFKLLQIPECTLNTYLEERCVSKDNIAIHYYGTDITWEEFLDKVDVVAKALKALGFGVNDQIPVFLRSVPEFLMLLLAAEKIGARIVCRDNLPHENAEAVKNTGSSVVIAHDFISQDDVTAIEGAGAERFVLLSPYQSADVRQLPDYIDNEIKALYTSETQFSAEVMDWNEFLALGENYKGEYLAPVDIDRPLYSAYTSGSTGTSKQVIHSAHTMIGVIHQMVFYGSSESFRPTWLVTILPPCLIAIVNSMLLMPLASNKLLVLDPFCNVNDIDLEMMRYRPNGWPLIPMFIEILMNSKRIPADYDISHLFAVGAGCESFNNGQVRRAQQFLRAHKSETILTVGYGLSEAGSNCVFPCPIYPVGNCNIGIPMPMNITSIFEPGTTKELGYLEFGEICISSPGIMLGYDNPEKTAEVLKIHEDGSRWLHTGDFGYMDENGVIFAFGRGNTERFRCGYLSEITMENRVVDADVPGLRDAFFVITEDEEHPGYHVPYLYVILEDGYTVADIEDRVLSVLNDFERPVDIIQLPERPFFHFKTNRIGLVNEIRAKKAAK